MDFGGAFIEKFSLPPTGDGSLSGLTFAIKDLIDVAGHRTGCGNPTWLATHPPAAVSAVCVDQLMAAGARCEGKAICDEVAFSLLGENYFYGTPLNPAAPDRVPGGSSSGSASAVAQKVVDFALGTDTGGSVRIPASNCGIWGWRPTHGVVSVAGVMPFSPTFDTVGILAGSWAVLRRAAAVLVGEEPPVAKGGEQVGSIHVLSEAFALADADVASALERPLAHLQAEFGGKVRETSLGELCDDRQMGDLSTWLDVFRPVRAAEVGSCLGSWVAAEHPKFGPAAAAGFEIVAQLDRRGVGEAIRRRERYCRQLQAAIGPRDLLCIPTAPAIAPLKGAASHDRNSDYYRRTLSLTSIAGIGRLPQVSIPAASVGGVPIGLSLIGAPHADLQLIEAAGKFAALCETSRS